MSFGSRLDEAITMRGITQRKFAKMVGTSEVSISRYISGERNPKMPTAIKMADILNVSLDWLAIDESERKAGKKADVIGAYQKGWNDAIDAMQNAKFVIEADRKTENSSEKPNNCEAKNYCDDCLYTDTCDSKEFFYACTSKATISKMEQVDEPSGDNLSPVEDEPQAETKTETQNSNLTFEKRKCVDCNFLTYMFGKTWCNIKCENPHDKVCDRFKPKDEPQAERPWGMYIDEHPMYE